MSPSPTVPDGISPLEKPLEARGVSPYSTREKIGRLLWAIVQRTLFRPSFHTWYGWRRVLLRVFGARIAHDARVRRTVTIEIPWNLSIGEDSSVGDHAVLYCLGPVTLGAHVSVSQRAHLCAGSHDYTKRDLPLLRPPITLEDHVWVAADAFVGPGVTVREGGVVGARAVVMRSTAPWGVYAGNPARRLRDRRLEGVHDSEGAGGIVA